MSSQPKMPSLAESKRDVTRTRLLDAALSAFNDKGYGAVTVDDIAASAGCSRATVYLYFSGKSPIMIALLERRLPDVIGACRSLNDELSAGIKLTQMRTRLEDTIRDWNAEPGLLAALNAATVTDPEVADWLAARENMVLDALTGFFATHPPAERRHIRHRALILGRMSLTAFGLSLPPDARSATHSALSDSEITDYLTVLWMDLFGGSAS